MTAQQPTTPNGATSTALTAPAYDGLRMVVSPAEALRRIEELQAFVKAVMVEGVDYGVIPGTGEKPSLYQPGAQKLCEVYGFVPHYIVDEKIEDWDKGLFYYVYRCELRSRKHGDLVGDGIGSCNSKEDKYAWRWVFESDLPHGIDKRTLKSRTRKSKKSGNDFTMYRLPNEDLFSYVNTIQKMGAKRALLHAVLGVTRSSGLFTQDVEDLPDDAFGEPEAVRSWASGSTGTDGAAQAHAAKANELLQQIKACSSLEELAKVGDLAKAAALPKEHDDPVRTAYCAKRDAMKAAAAKGAKASKGAAKAAAPAEPPADPQPANKTVTDAEFEEEPPAGAAPKGREMGED